MPLAREAKRWQAVPFAIDQRKCNLVACLLNRCNFGPRGSTPLASPCSLCITLPKWMDHNLAIPALLELTGQPDGDRKSLEDGTTDGLRS